MKDCAVRISASEAKGQLTELVRRAEAGDEVVLTRHGQPVVRLAPIRSLPEARRQLLEAGRASGSANATAGADAARSQDFLHDEDGLPIVGDDFAKTDVERALRGV
jgi:prevent-host-death family protein